MTILVDRDLRDLVAPAEAKLPPLATNIRPDIGRWNAKIQPASLDLTVGRILLPTEEDDDSSLLRKLSKDFLEFDRRIKTEVSKGVAAAQIITPIIAGVLAVALDLPLSFSSTED